MESIQLAQMLADLSDLNAAESHHAVALVNANKTLNPTSPSADATKPSEQLQARPGPRNHQRTASAGSGGSASFASRTASPAKFDKFGRRILTPPNTRTNSTYGSIPGTPRRETEVSSQPLFAATSTTVIALPRTIFPDISPHSLPSTTTDHVLKCPRWRDQQIDEDVDRANSFMALYDIRAKLKDQDNRSLNKLREKVAALHARQQADKKDMTGDAGRMKFSYPKSP